MTKEQSQWFIEGWEAVYISYDTVIIAVIVWLVWRKIDERRKKHPDW